MHIIADLSHRQRITEYLSLSISPWSIDTTTLFLTLKLVLVIIYVIAIQNVFVLF